MRWLAGVVVMALAPGAVWASCDPVAAPIVDLSFDSRYVDGDPTRSEIDLEAEADTRDALAPLDGFITDLTGQTDAALAAGDRDAAGCVVASLVQWAEADALSDLGTRTVELTIASRLAALALVAAQVMPVATAGEAAAITAWLDRRMRAQMMFWETAPDGAASGNLRAWAGLAGAATALVTDDAITRGWAAWSLSYVACTANRDGSLPQEMGRAHLALHYQLHAVAPLVVGAALLERQGVGVMNGCARALDRIVAFTLRDLAANGAETAAITGEDQTLNSGIEAIKDWQLAWGEAWLTLTANADLEGILAPRRPLQYSKLGGDQTRIWAR